MDCTRIDVLTTEHTAQIADMIQRSLRAAGLASDVYTSGLETDCDVPCIVICPHLFAALPKRYITYHIFKADDAHLFSDAYARTLRQAEAVLVDTIEGISYLQNAFNIGIKQFFYMPNEYGQKEPASITGESMLHCGNAFDFYFYRFLLANDLIDFDRFYALAAQHVHFPGKRLCVSLPESVERRLAFLGGNGYGFELFPALKHHYGWVGCGMSYKFITRKAQEQGFDFVMACEDDVFFPADFPKRLEQVLSELERIPDWDVFSGIMADVRDDVKLLSAWDTDCGEMLVVNRFISTVLNVYSKRMYEIVQRWDEKLRCSDINAIDRYFENQGNMKAVTMLPFLVGHKESLTSTIWGGDDQKQCGYDNSRYNSMIANAQNKLEQLAKQGTDASKQELKAGRSGVTQ